MPVAITVRGNDENVLAQVVTDGEIVSSYSGNTLKAIEAAADAAGVVLTIAGNDANVIEALASAVTVGGLVVEIGTATLAGNVATFDGSMSIIGVSDQEGTGEAGNKYICIRFNTTPAAAAYLLLCDGPGFAPANSISINMAAGGGNWTLSTTVAGVNSNAAYPAPALVEGDEVMLYRDGTTGAWGLVMPDGTDTGDISGTYGGVWAGAALAAFAAEIVGAVEFMPTGHALNAPATYTSFAAGA